jgi:hypothetical protein
MRNVMNDPEDNLQQILPDHFRAQLDTQLGRAEAAFARRLAAQTGARPPHRRHPAIWGLWAAGAIAASAGIVWGVVAHREMPAVGPAIQVAQRPQAVTPEGQSPSTQISVEQIVAYQTIDEGSVILEDQGPARKLRRQVMQTVEWYDPERKESGTVRVPIDQVVLVGTPSF